MLHLPSFHSLEVLVIDGGTYGLSLSIVLPDPISPSSLNSTLAFLDCDVAEGGIAELAQFPSNFRNTASTPLHRIVINNSLYGKLPSAASVRRLGEHVPVVEVIMNNGNCQSICRDEDLAPGR